MSVSESKRRPTHRTEVEGGADPTAISFFGRMSVTALGLGYLRPASGTWGSLPPVVAVMALLALDASTWQIVVLMAVSAVTASLLCMRFGVRAERAFGRKDPSQVVIDEVAGQSIALLWLPWSALGGSTLVGALSTEQSIVAISAFLAFRVFDIIKPPPAHALQRLHGGAGILIDDLLAGVYALGVTWVVAMAIMSRSSA